MNGWPVLRCITSSPAPCLSALAARRASGCHDLSHKSANFRSIRCSHGQAGSRSWSVESSAERSGAVQRRAARGRTRETYRCACPGQHLHRQALASANMPARVTPPRALVGIAPSPHCCPALALQVPGLRRKPRHGVNVPSSRISCVLACRAQRYADLAAALGILAEPGSAISARTNAHGRDLKATFKLLIVPAWSLACCGIPLHRGHEELCTPWMSAEA